MLLSKAVAVLVPKNFRHFSSGLLSHGSALYFRSFSGQGIIAATRHP